MSKTYGSYKELIINLQDRIKVLKEENLKLEDKLINILNIQSQNYFLTTSIPPNSKEIYKIVTNFIDESKIELIFASKFISSDILDLILKKLNELKNIFVITTKRNNIYEKDGIQSFDILASTPKINHFINPNINSTFIIKDKMEILLISGILTKIELISKLNTVFKISDQKIIEKYLKFYKNHLPSFMI